MATIPNRKTNFISRYLQYSLAALDSYPKYRSASENQPQCYRVNPVLHIDEVRLDDASSIPHMKVQTEKYLRADGDFLAMMDDLSWKMLASLFFFEFTSMPTFRCRGQRVSCRGLVTCRYQDDPVVRESFKAKYPRLQIYIGSKMYRLRGCNRIPVTFDVDSWSRPFNITLESGPRSASLTGFPESVEKLLASQLTLGVDEYGLTERISSKKRKTSHRSRNTVHKIARLVF